MRAHRSSLAYVVTMLAVSASVVAAGAGVLLLAGPARAADPPGDLQWTRHWLPATCKQVTDVHMVRAPGGDLIVAGTADRASGDADFAVARYSPGGKRRWARLFDVGPHHRQLLAGVAVDRHGNAVLVGSVGKTAILWCTIKVSPAGKRLWGRTLYGPAGKGVGKDVARAVGCDSRGAIYVAGALDRPAAGGDIALVKYSAAGARRWTRYFAGSGASYDDPTCLVVDAHDRIFVGGTVVDADADACVLRYSTLGKRIWRRVWDGSAANDVDSVRDIAAGPTGVVAAGVTEDSIGKNDGLVLKLALSSGADVWAPRIVAASNTDIVYVAAATNAAGQAAVTGAAYNRLSPNYPDLGFDIKLSLISDASSPPQSYGTMGATIGTGSDIFVSPTGRMIATGTLSWNPGGVDTAAHTVSYKPDSSAGWVASKEAVGRDITGAAIVVTSARVFVAGTDNEKLMLLRYVR